MPLQEAIIFGKNSSLQNPAGVGFGPPCKSKARDQEMWMRSVPRLRQVLKDGDAVGLLVQTRNGREWDAEAKNPKFNHKQDYIVAAYRLAAGLGTPWKPGLLILDWVTLFSLGKARMTTYQPTEGIQQEFQCSPAGCALSKNGSVKMVKFYEKGGKSREEAVNTQIGEMLMPRDKKTDLTTRYNAGWIGGYFASTAPKTFQMGSRSIATTRK